MFILSKLFDHLVLPPGLFILLLLIGCGFYLFKRRKVFWILLFSTLVLLYLFSIEPVHDLFLRPLEDRYPPVSIEEAGEAQYVVVLGGGVIADSPDEYGGSSPAGGAMKRLIYGMRIAKSMNMPVILAGGSSFPEESFLETEAESGSRILKELDFESDRVLMEKSSRNTWENAEQVKELYGPDTIILVTSGFHMPRSVLAFRKQDISSFPAPTDYRINRRPYSYRSYLPSAVYLEGVHAALKEYVGMFYYMLRR